MGDQDTLAGHIRCIEWHEATPYVGRRSSGSLRELPVTASPSRPVPGEAQEKLVVTSVSILPSCLVLGFADRVPDFPSTPTMGPFSVVQSRDPSSQD